MTSKIRLLGRDVPCIWTKKGFLLTTEWLSLALMEETDGEESSDHDPFGDRRAGRDDIVDIVVLNPKRVVEPTRMSSRTGTSL